MIEDMERRYFHALFETITIYSKKKCTQNFLFNSQSQSITAPRINRKRILQSRKDSTRDSLRAIYQRRLVLQSKLVGDIFIIIADDVLDFLYFDDRTNRRTKIHVIYCGKRRRMSSLDISPPHWMGKLISKARSYFLQSIR